MSIHELTDEQLDELIASNPDIQAWKSLPKASRERLTKKQLLKMYKENTLSETL
jgi:hypothetical protein